MQIEVKNAANLVALLKAYPQAKVHSLVTRPGEDAWAVVIDTSLKNDDDPVVDEAKELARMRAELAG